MYNGFNANRKGNPFGNVGVDMALEPTINTVAKKAKGYHGLYSHIYCCEWLDHH